MKDCVGIARSTLADAAAERRRQATLIYCRSATSYVRRVLTLIDRNPTHETYGCCDREHWHYRTSDFASGMYQEAALALQLAADLGLEPSSDRLRELAQAACHFVVRIAHRNGSLDDYYPFEQAVGATAFTLRAVTAVLLAQPLSSSSLTNWVKRAATWLSQHIESGRLANHHALSALAVYQAARVLRSADLACRARALAQRVLEWQSSEGWFPEYDGCDPGYHTVTIAFLADLWRQARWPELKPALAQAVRFAAAVQHPDGTVGGEYGSRNTTHAYAHGFELLAPDLQDARYFLTKLMSALADGRLTVPDDDRMVAHYAVDRLLAARDAAAFEPVTPPIHCGTDWFPESGILVAKSAPWWLLVSTLKGGSFRLYEGKELLAADVGLVVQQLDGTVWATAKAKAERVVKTEREICIEGRLHQVRHPVVRPLQLFLLRLANLTVGRIAPDLLRRFLQAIAITDQNPGPLRYRRLIRWGPPFVVRDEVTATCHVGPLTVWAPSDATFSYMAASNVFHRGALLPWTKLATVKAGLRAGEVLVFQRSFPDAHAVD